MLDLRLIRSFVAVAETEHVGKAAERLHVSQSPLSRQIQQLEALLGLPLFERKRRRIHLTQSGRWLLDAARPLLIHAERVEREAAGRAGGQLGSVALGTVPTTLWSALIPSALQAFRRNHPQVRLEVHTLSAAAQFERLLQGDLDLGLTHRAPASPELVSHRLYDERLLLVLPAAHPLARRRSITPAQLDGAPWIALSSAASSGALERLLAACGKAGFVPEIRCAVNDPSAILGLVEAGVGFALMPAAARRVRSNALVFTELPWLPLSWPVFLARRNGGASLAADELADVLAAMATGPARGEARARTRPITRG